MIRKIFYIGSMVLAILLGIQAFTMMRTINRQVIAACQMIDPTITTMDECEVQRDSLKIEARKMISAEWDTLTARADSFAARIGSTAVRMESAMRRLAKDTTP